MAKSSVIVIKTMEQWRDVFYFAHAAILFHAGNCGPCKSFVPLWIALADYYTQQSANWIFYSAPIDYNEEIMTALGIFAVPQVVLIMCPYSKMPEENLKECKLVDYDGISRLVCITKRYINSEYIDQLRPWLLARCNETCTFAHKLNKEKRELKLNPSKFAEREYLTLASLEPTEETQEIKKEEQKEEEEKNKLNANKFVNKTKTEETSAIETWFTPANPLLGIGTPVTVNFVYKIEDALLLFRNPLGYWSAQISKRHNNNNNNK